MARRPSTIRSLPFRHNAKPQLGFEIFRWSQLVERFDRNQIDHPYEAPRQT